MITPFFGCFLLFHYKENHAFFLSKSLSCKLLQELIDYFFDQVYAISFIIIAMDPLVFFTLDTISDRRFI